MSRVRVLLGWALLVLLFFLWQSFGYRGIPASVAEWQFQRFGVYFPVLTLLLLVLLFASPSFYLLRYRRRTRSVPAGGVRLLRYLVVIAIGLWLAALVSVLFVFTLPRGTGTPTQIVVGTPEASQPHPGLVTLHSRVRYDRVSAYDDNLLLFRRSFRFAPAQAEVPTSTPPSRVRYFVELVASDQRLTETTPHTGLLVRDGLPGEIIRLYRYAGYDIEQSHYVLFASREAMRWPYFVFAGQFALAGLLFALAALLQQARVRRLRERLAAEQAAATEA